MDPSLSEGLIPLLSASEAEVLSKVVGIGANVRRLRNLVDRHKNAFIPSVEEAHNLWAPNK